MPGDRLSRRPARGPDAFSPIAVSCHAGYRGEETPRRFCIGQNTIEIESILDRWVGPDHRYFKVADREGAVYILRHDENACEWSLVFYRSGDAPGRSPG